MKTYQQKMDELRMKSLKIIENGISSNDPSAFVNAVLFITFNINGELNKEMPIEPDVLDSELIEEKEK